MDRFVTTAGEYFKAVTSKSTTESNADPTLESTSVPEFTERSIEAPPTATPSANDGSTGPSTSTESENEQMNTLNSGEIDTKNMITTKLSNTSEKEEQQQDIVEDDGRAAAGGEEDIEGGKISSEAATIAPSFLHTASGSGSAVLDIANENDSVDPGKWKRNITS